MISYKDSGVNIDLADEFVDSIKNKVKKLPKPFLEKLPLGAFSFGFSLNIEKPVITCATDGVGTKLLIARELGVHNTVGIDLVAMNVNDILTSGSYPVVFLDYIATGKINKNILEEVIDGIVKGCEESSCYLGGGETAEMPDFYGDDEYDLAGFCIGAAREEDIINPNDQEEGDILIGLRSSGFHSNGYSLVRKVIKNRALKLSDYIEDLNQTLGEALLRPTNIYVKDIKTLRENGIKISLMAHITGGGIKGNLVRPLRDNLRAIVEKTFSLDIFNWFYSLNEVSKEEMLKVFNMGLGFIIGIKEKDKEKALSLLGDKAIICGYLEKGQKEVLVKF